jgi:hypothetical protein
LHNQFCRVGYGLPLFHWFSGVRRLLFGSHTKFNVGIAVLFVFYFAALMVTVKAAVYQIRKQQEQILEKNRKNSLQKYNNYYKTQNIINKKP